MTVRRETSADSAARFLALREHRAPEPAPRRLVAKPEALAARRVTGKLNGRLLSVASTIDEMLGQPLASMLGFAPSPSPVGLSRADLEEIRDALEHKMAFDALAGTFSHATVSALYALRELLR